MAHLDLFKTRDHSTVKLDDGKTYKIPNEFTVEELERLFEKRRAFEAIKDEQVEDSKIEEQTERLYQAAFAQLEIVFQHYHPEMTADKLRQLLTPSEALEILGFFDEYRHATVKEHQETNNADDSKQNVKKNLKPAEEQLRELRRVITLMVMHGFGLREVRKLYIDELDEYYKEMFFNLEKQGKAKEGTYAKIVNKTQGDGANATVNQLRKQMMNNIKNQKHG